MKIAVDVAKVVAYRECEVHRGEECFPPRLSALSSREFEGY